MFSVHSRNLYNSTLNYLGVMGNCDSTPVSRADQLLPDDVKEKWQMYRMHL